MKFKTKHSGDCDKVKVEMNFEDNIILYLSKLVGFKFKLKIHSSRLIRNLDKYFIEK